jgi:hypothetical protein
MSKTLSVGRKGSFVLHGKYNADYGKVGTIIEQGSERISGFQEPSAPGGKARPEAFFGPRPRR